MTPPKPDGAQVPLYSGRSSSADVPGGSGPSVVLGSASRTLCDDALPAGAANTIARRGPNRCQ